MAARKRWRTLTWPGGDRRMHTNQADAYRYVEKSRLARRRGLVRTEVIVVEVSEAGSSAWSTYERVRLT